LKFLLALMTLALFIVPPDFAAAAVKKKKNVVAPSQPAFSQAALDEVQDRAANGPGALENAAALVPFFEQVMHPIDGGSVHILQYGDSHTASDDWANAMRLAFQAKFGAGGPGFALAGHPYLGYRRFDVSGTNTVGWVTEGTTGRPGDGRLGLGGVSITSHHTNDAVTFDAESDIIRLFYLKQPGGGDFVISVDGRAMETVSTDGDLEAAYLALEIRGGQHHYAIRTIGLHPVRLFGWAADKQSGITYETLGINGAQAPMILEWDEAVFASNMGARRPALIVLEYGTNEALNPRFTEEGYRQQFSQVLAKMRRAAPLASILVVGPPDCLKASRPLPHINEVIAAQRAAAVDAGCAFWDWRERMGGPGVVKQWAKARLGQPDHIHLTGAGYQLTASMLFHDLMEQYDRYIAARAE
jgi:lysophospholipase L1-like esterase